MKAGDVHSTEISLNGKDYTRSANRSLISMSPPPLSSADGVSFLSLNSFVSYGASTNLVPDELGCPDATSGGCGVVAAT